MYWSNKIVSLVTKNPSNTLHLVYLYRLITLVLTSLFYLFAPANIPFPLKIGIIVSVAIAAWIITDLQRKYIEHSRLLKFIVLTETFGLTLLLIPTGGIESPFIWYALNPVLVAASFLSPLFCWGVLAFYLISASIFAYFLFPIHNFLVLLQENSSLYLVCLLITSLVMLFSGFTKELSLKAVMLKTQQDQLLEANQKLFKANDMYKETLEHIMSLYHLMDNFSSQKNIESFMHEITVTLSKCTQKESALFWLMDFNLQKIYLSNNTVQNDIEHLIKLDWHRISQKKEAFFHQFDQHLYWMKIVRTSKNIGFIGIQIQSVDEKENSFLLERTFDFFTDLSEIMLERIHLDNMLDQMMIMDEQNRIANEIHDTVSQKLFGIVYSLHSLKQKQKSISEQELNEEYQFLLQIANSSIKELRAAIYRLSSVKNGEKTLFLWLKNYLEEYAKLNNIMIHHQFTGNDSLISNNMKLEIYRIICESCGNAVRHGGCQIIDLKLVITNKMLLLTINDDGIGFRTPHQPIKENGLGLFNMKSIVNSLGGTFTLNGQKKSGTTIHIEIPIENKLTIQEV